MAPELSIVVVTWNVRRSLERCLRSIDTHADVSYELFVIDNGSKDTTREFLASFKPENRNLSALQIVYNDRDLGYSTAVNMGLRRAAGKYILLLNPDTAVDAPIFQRSIAIAEALPLCGVLGVKILNPDGSIQSSVSPLPSLGMQLLSRFGLHKRPWIKARSMSAAMRAFNYSRAAEVEQVKGAVMFFPKHVLDTAGLWDEQFFLWFEDSDFCRRVRNAGFKIYYTPEVHVMHESQTGISKMPFFERQRIWQRSIAHYFTKHHGRAAGCAIAVLDPLCMLLGMALKKIRRR